jgi:acyl-coenzyme A synthetase/AMP-(fatty) acid ligase
VDEDDYLWFVGSSNDVIKSSEYRNAYGIGPFEVGSIFFDRAYMCA